MNLHPLPPDAKCPYCGQGGLAFVRQRGRHGDLYRCTAAIPCEGFSLHHGRSNDSCGVSAEAKSGHLLNSTQCHSHVPSENGEMIVEYLTTRATAQRLHIPINRIARLLASGTLSGTKSGARWQIPVAALKEYSRTRPAKRRIARAVR